MSTRPSAQSTLLSVVKDMAAMIWTMFLIWLASGVLQGAVAFAHFLRNPQNLVREGIKSAIRQAATFVGALLILSASLLSPPVGLSAMPIILGGLGTAFVGLAAVSTLHSVFLLTQRTPSTHLLNLRLPNPRFF